MESLRAHRLLALVRGKDPAAALRTVTTLAEEGIAAVEVSLTTTDALTVIERARAEMGPDALIGAGTVRTPADAARAVDAGASCLVTPAVVDGLAGIGVPVLMGVLTPTEIERALALGGAAIKIFPASLGGPDYLSALRSPFPDGRFVHVDIAPAPGSPPRAPGSPCSPRTAGPSGSTAARTARACRGMT
ncbi:bifunctional 4-hydroxy-2-oxoglutarate aldolase/2-dehydro-3-deoxy-phosphogluconate aldolase [Streptomyces sp. A2-16]|uniref:bifunctional 4-hydroxy-2-oxoglutarate aldolase/2-dehydro-3-deoxy-phosphogluconate aldolase n=1 Tax=Streptomyces sp. A2-16 TaxID=2781734 RepID=UPI00201332E7|nr:bifunctional 4-hydroxy-2-oxoglutarate aldolase/2-dehydro-3-deoxy-phosphogluconate aldolase [Streptomyces sp. A2-16]